MAKWIIDEAYDDGYEHHKCSHCNTRALFDYIMEEDYDENSGHTEECKYCGFYPWASDELPFKYKYRGELI